MDQKQKLVYEAWADKILNDSLAGDRDELKKRIVAMLCQSHANGRKEGRQDEIMALALHISQRCGGGNVNIPDVGEPLNPIKKANHGAPAAPTTIRKIPKEDINALYLKVMSDDPSSTIDLVLKIERGGSFKIELPEKAADEGVLKMPGNIPPDQKCLVVVPNSIRCRNEEDEWEPPWGYEDEGMGWKPNL